MKAKSPKNVKGPKVVPQTDADYATDSSENLLVAAIGASAGGLEAGIDLVRQLDPDTGMAYVFIQHLDPTHSSIIKDLLAKETSMPVREVTDGTRVAPTTFM